MIAADPALETIVVPVRDRRRWPAWFALVSLLVLGLGAIEGWYGKTDSGDVYGSDAVQYLDIARAIERRDWHSALNPLWSQGYPALLALARPIFVAGAWGDWLDTRVVNFVIFCLSWAGFCWFLQELLRSRAGRAAEESLGAFLAAAAAIFVLAQLTIDQVSRAGPDQLVAALFFLSCALLLRLLAQPGKYRGMLLGMVLGVGFLAKAVFLPLGCVVVVVAATALWRRVGWRALPLAASCGAVFLAIALAYGAALSSAVGHPTLGEAGAINYAWHVDRLHKWVHWQGGVDPADKAWPKPAFARFAHWESDPPDFGRPIHPTVIIGTAPRIYAFHETAPNGEVMATYVPYYDPSYWYAGYRHVVRWRYVLIALGKNAVDLATVLVTHPFFVVELLGFAVFLVWPSQRRRAAREVTSALWPVVALALIGICIFLPVHLEGRYLSSFLAVLSVVVLAATLPVRSRAAWGAFILLIAVGVVMSQAAVWRRPLTHWTPVDNVEWRAGQAVAGLGLPAGSQVAAIAWDPNLHCDWAYMAQVRITSEIATGADEEAFWALPADGQAEVLARFQAAGARAVLTWDKPQGAAIGWSQLPGVPMWVYRFW